MSQCVRAICSSRFSYLQYFHSQLSSLPVNDGQMMVDCPKAKILSGLPSNAKHLFLSCRTSSEILPEVEDFDMSVWEVDFRIFFLHSSTQ